MKRVIVFGASGDIGRNFIEYFLEHNTDRDFQICAVSRTGQGYFQRLGVPHYLLDVTKKEDFNILPADAYAVVDFAGLMPARMQGYNPYDHINVNIIGNLNILEYCVRTHADRILFSHSFGDIKDYGEKEVLLKRDLARKFSYTSDHTVYVMCKNFTVDLLEHYHQVYGLKNFVFRLPTIYSWSPIDHFYVDGKLRKIGYRILIDKAIKGEPIEVWGDATRKKDMIYVKDACQMFFKALFVDREGGLYNVGTGVGISLLEQIEGIIEVFSSPERKSKIIMCPEKSGAPQYIMDIKEAKQELGYCPQYNYIAMLQDMKREMNRLQASEGKFAKNRKI